MKRIIVAVAFILAVSLLFCSCGNVNKNRLNYNYDMSLYVKLDSYEVEVDSASDSYKEYYGEKMAELLTGEVTEGAVREGDIANIDYVGTKDGKPFSGGGAEGYDLTIGSGVFIPGFEDGLIGKEIGTTVDLNLTFPEDYKNSPDLAGAEVVFTVTINYCQREYDELTDENAKLLGYESAAEIEKAAADHAKKIAAWSKVYANAKLDKYPEKENNVFVDILVYQTDIELQVKEGYTLQQYLAMMGSSMEKFRESAQQSTDVAQMKKNYALCYYIIDAEGEAVTPQMVDKKIATGINEGVSRNFVEMMVVMEMAQNIVGEKATIK